MPGERAHDLAAFIDAAWPRAARCRRVRMIDGGDNALLVHHEPLEGPRLSDVDAQHPAAGVDADDLGRPTASADDDTPVRFEGRVLWIAGTTLVAATEESQSITVDLTHVPLDEYLRLRSNDYIVVVGTIPIERNRIVATSIEPLEP